MFTEDQFAEASEGLTISKTGTGWVLESPKAEPLPGLRVASLTATRTRDGWEVANADGPVGFAGAGADPEQGAHVLWDAYRSMVVEALLPTATPMPLRLREASGSWGRVSPIDLEQDRNASAIKGN